MKKTKLFVILLCFVSSLFSSELASGTEPGSFFYSNLQYSSIPEEHRALFYSPDHGETFIRRYFYEGQIHKNILTDATPGVLYLYSNESFEVSFDFGATWQFVEVPGINVIYTIGSSENELYKNDSGSLYRSIDNGYNYALQNPENDTLFYKIEGGIEEGEIYYYGKEPVWPPSGIFYIAYSNDFGVNFDVHTLNPEIAESLNLNETKIYKGSVTGEIFLVGLSSPTHYEIYFSNDYGQSFELKYVGEEYEEAIEGYGFASGNEPGSFYMIYHLPEYLPDQVNVQITFFHSSDYGETFTEEYYHYFDDTFENPDYLIAYPDYLEVNGDAGNIEFQVASNVNWNVVYDSEWIASVSPGSGNGDGALTVEYTENLSSPRTANITIQTNDAEDVEVSIRQDTNADADYCEIENGKLKMENYPNPFNPNTTISFSTSRVETGFSLASTCPPHQTVHAVFPHTAFRQSSFQAFTVSSDKPA